MSDEIREWARRCADVTRGRMPEYEAWDQIAERGEEWDVALCANGKPYQGGGLMTPKQCFSNSARTVLGLTAFDPTGCKYAEGFAQSAGLGLWMHHGWVVSASGLVIDRTWEEVGTRYVGVTFDEFPRSPGCCQLTEWPLGIAWGPNYADHPEVVNQLFSSKDVVKN